MFAVWLDLFASVAALTFCAATVYIALVEHPARMQLPTDLAVRCFRESYKRALIFQPTLLRSSFLASAFRCGSAVKALQRAHIFNLIGSLLIMGFSKKLIIPVGNALLAADQLSDYQARQLLEEWGKKHAVRTLVSCVIALTLLTVQMQLV